MPVITSAKSKPEYDVAIVGSGAGGAQMAYTLTLQGLKCVMLEAGRNYDPVTETPMFQAGSHAPLGGSATPEKPFGFHDATVDGGWQVPGEPYTQGSEKPEEQFKWWRARMLGGRTNHWGRISLRNGPYDFKPKSRDGLGFDWPISYEDVAPYYDKTEMLVGVYGTNEGMENTPNSPPGVLLPAPKARLGELYAQKHAKKVGVPIIPIHRAVLEQGDRCGSGGAEAASEQQEGAEDRGGFHEAARAVFLGDGVRARLHHRGGPPDDHGATAAGARDRAISTSLPTHTRAR